MIPTLLSPAHLEACFAADYAGAHARFRHACDRHEYSGYQEFVYKEKGPKGEKLITAVAWIGRRQAKRVLVLQSGVHGVEGFAGSAIQIDCLDYLFKSKPHEDLAILFIHALNPYGFAWLRRVNENGIDLNRNFIDFSQSLPANDTYTMIAELLVPLSEDDFQQAEESLLAKRKAWGHEVYEQVVTAGQYCHADGLFYGGHEPSQSRLYLEGLTSQLQLDRCEQLAVLDIHTGLGPFGYGELICDHPPGSLGVAWAKETYGNSVTEPALGTSSSAPKHGLVDYHWQAQFDDKVSFLTLEFGTWPVTKMFEVLRADHLLHRKSFNWNDKQVQRVKQALVNHFYPATADWQEMVLMRGRQVVGQAMAGLMR